MRWAKLPTLVQYSLLVALTRADPVVYVTDLSIFTYLAPCAANAVSYIIQSQTYENCPEAVTALQSCVCTKNNNFGFISSAISSSVSAECGSTASQDQASASTVLSAYCNQNSQPTFPTPTIPVSQYITDIPELSYLAPCAMEQLTYAVQSMTYEFCPPDAPDLATCVCQKNQNSLKVSQTINASVKDACSSHTADISSAQAFFAAYCAMNSGTSSFPTPTNPPGDMTYYITDLPQYSALPRCAQSAVSDGVFTNTWDLCPEGPQALASCACIKESMSGYVSSIITSSVKWECTSTDLADITSALAVFDVYCSAALNLAVATGVTNSVSQTLPPGATLPAATAPKATGGSTAGSGGSSGGSSGGNGGGGGGSGGDSAGGSSSSSGPKTPLIVGAIVGVVAGLALIGAIVFFVMRHARRNRDPMPTAIQLDNQPPPNEFGGKVELAGNPIIAGPHPTGTGAPLPPPSPSPSMMKHGLSPGSNSVSPVSAYGNAYPPSNASELQGQNSQPPMPQYNGPFPGPSRSELAGQVYNANGAQPANYAELQGQTYNNAPPNRSELYGQPYNQVPQQGPYGQAIHEFPAQQPVYQADSRPIQRPAQSNNLQPVGWQSGPVQQYAELDGDYARSQQPHAR